MTTDLEDYSLDGDFRFNSGIARSRSTLGKSVDSHVSIIILISYCKVLRLGQIDLLCCESLKV